MSRRDALSPQRSYYGAVRFILSFIVVFGVLGGVGIYAAFLFVDGKVAMRLAAPSESGVSAIYSDVVKIDSSTPVEAIEQQLRKRRYREVTSSPEHPGEFFRRSDSLTVFTRDVLTPEGRAFPHRKVTLGPLHTSERAFLEAQVIAVLGQGSTRTSDQRSLADFPPKLIQAVVSIEDERFLHHDGFDLKAIARALLNNLLAGRVVQGGSTITQQLAKGLLFSREKSLKRKLLEALAAVSLERRLSKDRILEMYLNEVYIGQEGNVALHGVESAARSFFGKRLEDLEVAEVALLAGIIQAPSLYSPRRHPKRAQERRDVVLQKMRELGYLKQKEYSAALKAPVHVLQETFHQKRAPHYIASLTQFLEQSLGIEALHQGSVQVYTGIDLDLQGCAEKALESTLAALEKKFPRIKRESKPLEGALVSLEPFSGKVKAWVGGRDFARNQFDHVLHAQRQIGSTIKPFLYLTAFDGSLNSYKVATATSVLRDEPLKVNLITKDTWVPENYDREFRGDVTARYALENSLNLPSVQILQRIGVGSFVKTLSRLHLAGEIPAVPALALGALDTSPLQLTAAFGALANGGVYTAPRLFTSVLDADREPILASDIVEERVAKEAPTFVVTNLLQGAVERGTGKTVRALGYTLPVAGKTGTSNEARDLWFVGYTPDLVTGVWIGFDDNAKVGLTGGGAAAPLWTEFMECASAVRPPSKFVVPKGVVFADVDVKTGLRVSENCPADEAVQEIFVAGTEPSWGCDLPSRELGVAATQDIEESPRTETRRSFWERLFGE